MYNKDMHDKTESVPEVRKVHSTQDLMDLHLELCDAAAIIIKKKNSDYGGADEPFRNFHVFGAFGILVRLSDKIARLRTFLEKLQKGEAMAVFTESFEDTAIDVINYIVLFVGYVRTFGAEK